jgi:hypothetical protein
MEDNKKVRDMSSLVEETKVNRFSCLMIQSGANRRKPQKIATGSENLLFRKSIILERISILSLVKSVMSFEGKSKPVKS